MRSGDTQRRSVIRYLRSEIHNAEITKQKDLNDADVIEVLTKQAKQRRESMEAYKNANRPDLIEQENAELDIILEYLPDQMSDDEITLLATEVIKETDAINLQDIGKVMGIVIPKTKGRADGSRVSAIVKTLLEEKAD